MEPLDPGRKGGGVYEHVRGFKDGAVIPVNRMDVETFAKWDIPKVKPKVGPQFIVMENVNDKEEAIPRKIPMNKSDANWEKFWGYSKMLTGESNCGQQRGWAAEEVASRGCNEDQAVDCREVAERWQRGGED